MKTERVVIKMSQAEYEELKALAESNTSGNIAGLVRSLVHRAYLFPSEFSLLPPSAKPVNPTTPAA